MGKYDFNSVATRELRRKNPLGVSKGHTFDWENVDLTFPGVPWVKNPTEPLDPGVDNKLNDHLLAFQKTQDGLDASAWLLHDSSKYFGNATPSLHKIGQSWAGFKGDKDQNGIYDYTDELYLIFNSYRTTVKIDDVLTYGDDAIYVMKSLARMENGSLQVYGIPDEMYLGAVAYGAS